MNISKRALLIAAMTLAGCSTTDPSIEVTHRVTRGSTVAVVMFRDCDVTNQAACDGSGLDAGAIFVRVLSQKPGLHAVSLPRPVGPKAPLGDDTAVAYAKAKGYKYVLNGEVQDYYNAGHMTFHPNRAAVSVHVLSTSDGKLLSTYTYQKNATTNFTSPDSMLEDMARQVAASIIAEPKRQRQGDFLISGGKD